MKKLLLSGAMLLSITLLTHAQSKQDLRHAITLDQAHVGNLSIDTMLLNSYQKVAPNVEQFYIASRSVFQQKHADFCNTKIIASAAENNIALMGGPMLGCLKPDGVTIWLRPANTHKLNIRLTKAGSKKSRLIELKPNTAGKAHRIVIDNLRANTVYHYTVSNKNKELATGHFCTSPKYTSKDEVRVVFGSCFHKIGLHNPQLINTIVNRNPHVMMLLGDIAVDDRNGNFAMHRADYLLRDLAPAWQQLAANVPLYTNWDDHDYRDNDLNGVSGQFSAKDRDELRKLWVENWNNPAQKNNNIYFNAQIGQVELIMLDTRSCRDTKMRGKYGSYLGTEQLEWLKEVLRHSTAKYKIISSGTMWSDNISNGKDSWGTWDKQAREEILRLIEKEHITGTLLISGDRHGARGITIPRSGDFRFYEFEAASLGGVPGPPAMGNDASKQIFGYAGEGLKAFGEFTFYCSKQKPHLTFRLIDEQGAIMEEHRIDYEMLLPK